MHTEHRSQTGLVIYSLVIPTNSFLYSLAKLALSSWSGHSYAAFHDLFLKAYYQLSPKVF